MRIDWEDGDFKIIDVDPSEEENIQNYIKDLKTLCQAMHYYGRFKIKAEDGFLEVYKGGKRLEAEDFFSKCLAADLPIDSSWITYLQERYESIYILIKYC